VIDIRLQKNSDNNTAWTKVSRPVFWSSVPSIASPPPTQTPLANVF
jgi:hypothetical protein